MNNKIKIIFAGTPEFAVPYFEGLFHSSDFSVIGVITQSDKPSGRKQELTPPPIKLAAQNYQIKIWQPEKLRDNYWLVEELKTSNPDLLVVVAYGQIIPLTILNLFPCGAINVHPSLLPKYRGPSPIQSAILNEETETGISIMLMDEKMDHGPILSQDKMKLTGEETNESLHQLMAIRGVPLLIKTIKDFLDKKIIPQPQNDQEATFCHIIDKETAKINWQNSAKKINAQIRALYHWPIAWTILNDKRLKIFPPTKIIENFAQIPGLIKIINDKIHIQCGQQALEISQVQLEGKKIMSSQEIINGFKNFDGAVLK